MGGFRGASEQSLVNTPKEKYRVPFVKCGKYNFQSGYRSVHPINFFPLSCLNFGVGLRFSKLILNFKDFLMETGYSRTIISWSFYFSKIYCLSEQKH